MSETEEQSRAAIQPKAIVAIAGTVALLLLGIAVGLLIRLPDSTASPSEDSVEVGFAQDMAVHHNQAVEMANIARERSANPDIRQLAFDIGSTQLEQIGRMKGWLFLWEKPEQPVAGSPMAWMDKSSHDHNGGTSNNARTTMPGMASSDEILKLRSLSGAEFDVYFLQLMLRHHQGGVPMAQYAAEHADQNVVRTLADSILRSQAAESDYMTQLLSQRNATPLPAPK